MSSKKSSSYEKRLRRKSEPWDKTYRFTATLRESSLSFADDYARRRTSGSKSHAIDLAIEHFSKSEDKLTDLILTGGPQKVTARGVIAVVGASLEAKECYNFIVQLIDNSVNCTININDDSKKYYHDYINLIKDSGDIELFNNHIRSVLQDVTNRFYYEQRQHLNYFICARTQSEALGAAIVNKDLLKTIFNESFDAHLLESMQEIEKIRHELENARHAEFKFLKILVHYSSEVRFAAYYALNELRNLDFIEQMLYPEEEFEYLQQMNLPQI